MVDNEYSFYEKGKVIFQINKTNLQFDVKKLYLAFFADDKDYLDIELENNESSDKDATRIFNCTEQLVKKTVAKLAEEYKESSNSTMVSKTLT